MKPNFAVPPWLPPLTVLPESSAKNFVAPSSGRFVMYRTVPESEPEPNSVPWGPRRTSTRDTSKKSRSGVNRDIEMTDSSRYAPTDSLTPGWSRAIWPEEMPRMATWLWPGPKFWTLKPATLAATSSMFSMPRSRMSPASGAATETGTLIAVSSRFIAVTVASAASFSSSATSTVSVPPAASRWSLWTTFRKPCTSADTV